MTEVESASAFEAALCRIRDRAHKRATEPPPKPPITGAERIMAVLGTWKTTTQITNELREKYTTVDKRLRAMKHRGLIHRMKRKNQSWWRKK